jgi:hypothetical protein
MVLRFMEKVVIRSPICLIANAVCSGTKSSPPYEPHCSRFGDVEQIPEWRFCLESNTTVWSSYYQIQRERNLPSPIIPNFPITLSVFVSSHFETTDVQLATNQPLEIYKKLCGQFFFSVFVFVQFMTLSVLHIVQVLLNWCRLRKMTN